MYLTSRQKLALYNEFIHNCCDPYEFVPTLNYTLDILGYHDYLEHDDDYENIKWSVR